MTGHTRLLSAWMAGIVLAVLSQAQAQPAAESSNLIVDVKVEGNKVVNASSVLGGVKTRPGQTFDEKLIKEDEQRLLKTRRYETVIATVARGPQGVTVTFVVSERPLISKIVFSGNKIFKSEELMKDLSFGINDPLDQFNVEAGRQTVLSKYRAKGYYYADVKIDPAALRDQNQIVYSIVEGPKVAIKAIKFKGNKFFWDIQLRMEIGQGQEWWPFTSGAMDSEQVDRDVATIRGKYATEGFLDAKVGRLVEFSPDQKKVTLTFVIEEGPRYRINSVTFRGNTIYSDTELYKRLLMKQGAFYTAVGLKHDVTAVENTYGEVGFIYAAVTPKKAFVNPAAPPPAWTAKLKESKPALVNVIYEIREQDQYHIGHINIKGNTLTQARIIRRELKVYPEQLYNTVAIEESKHRLMETRIFDKVEITPEVPEGEGDSKVRNPLVKITEGKSAQFMVGVGVSSNEGLIGTVSVTQRNFNILGWPKTDRDISEGRAFKGAGQTLTLAAQPGTEVTNIHADWFEPYVFDLPYTLGASLFYFDALRETYKETRYGVTASVGHRFQNGWYAEFATRAEEIREHDLQWNAPPEVIADAGTKALLGLKGSLTKDRTDSRWTPTTGDRFTIAYEQVTGDFNFGRANAEYKIYRTVYVDALDRKHVLMGRLAGGDIVGGIAPVYEKFYAGGIGSVRGFRFRGISPRSAGTDQPIGGRFDAFVGTQYEFPLITTLLRGVVFVDSGTVENDFGVTAWRASIGTGVRLVLPLFGQIPIAADVAVPVMKKDGDNEQIFSFNIGVTF